jgi:hypothetical protein
MTTSKHFRKGPYTKSGVHPAQIDPKKSNLPRDPVTGKILPPKKGDRLGPNGHTIVLAKKDISRAFEMLGGVQGLVKWARKNDKNEYAFYVHIWPRLLGAQALDEAAEKLSTRPTIVRIENVLVDPVDESRSRVINNVGSSSFSREAQDAQLVDEAELVDEARERTTVRRGIEEQAQEAGLGEEEAGWLADRLTEIPL